MDTLLQQIVRNSSLKPGITLVVGAGDGATLPALRQLGSRRLVLVEAHPRQAEELARRVQLDQGEEVWSLAITPDSSSRTTLQVLNNLRYSSLRTPQALFECAPNLRVVGQVDVPARSLSEAIEQLALDEHENHVLILDAPGLGRELFHSAPSAMLRSFAWILLCGGSLSELYVDDVAVAKAAIELIDVGFDQAGEEPDTLYPWATLLMQRNAQRIGALRLQEQLADLHRQMDHANEMIAALVTARDNQSRLAAERQTQLEQVQKALEERQHQAEDLANKQTVLAQENIDLTKQLEQGQKIVADCKEEMIALAGEKAALVQEQANLNGQLTQARKALTEHQGQVKALTAEKAALAGEKTELTEQLTQARKALTEHQGQVKALTAEKAALAGEKTELTEQLTQARKALTEHQGQVKALTAEKATLVQERTDLTMQLEQAQKTAADHKSNLDAVQQQTSKDKKQIQQLQAQNSETAQRQQLFQEELIKAEAQIELIKDLLLREPGL